MPKFFTVIYLNNKKAFNIQCVDFDKILKEELDLKSFLLKSSISPKEKMIQKILDKVDLISN